MDDTSKRIVYGAGFTVFILLVAHSLGILEMTHLKGIAVFLGIVGGGHFLRSQAGKQHQALKQAKQNSSFYTQDDAIERAERWSKNRFSRRSDNKNSQRQISFRWEDAQINSIELPPPPKDPKIKIYSLISNYGEKGTGVQLFIDARDKSVMDYLGLKNERDQRKNPFKYCPTVRQYRREQKMNTVAKAYSNRRRSSPSKSTDPIQWFNGNDADNEAEEADTGG